MKTPCLQGAALLLSLKSVMGQQLNLFPDHRIGANSHVEEANLILLDNNDLSSLSKVALLVSERLQIVQKNHHDSHSFSSNHQTRPGGRSLVSLDFVTTCTELNIIFHNHCSCANYNLEISNQINCAFNGMNAVANFNQYDLTLSSLEVCKDAACISIYYSEENALFCETTAMNGQTCDCYLCNPDNITTGMLGLNITCPDGSLSTQGCRLASSVLDLGDWKAPMTAGAKAGLSLGLLIFVVLLAGGAWWMYRRRGTGNGGHQPALHKEEPDAWTPEWNDPKTDDDEIFSVDSNAALGGPHPIDPYQNRYRDARRSHQTQPSPKLVSQHHRQQQPARTARFSNEPQIYLQ